MMQRDIYLADMNPVRGSEQSGTRPVVIISGDTMNRNLPVRIVCPITSKRKGFAACVSLSTGKKHGLRVESEIITFQIRTISTKRLLRKLGTITAEELTEVFHGLGTVLRY